MRCLLVPLLLGLMACTLHAAEEQFVLTDGRTVTGEVQSETADDVQVKVTTGTIAMTTTLAKADITKREPVEPTAADTAQDETGTGSYHPKIVDWVERRLVNAQGERLEGAAGIADKPYLILYFSASWCGPCRKFTPRLVEWYDSLGEDRDVEVLFISNDNDRGEMEGYMQEDAMPWPALVHGPSRTKRIAKAYAGRGIPCLTLLGPEDEVLAHSYNDKEYLGPSHVLEAYARIRGEQRLQQAQESGTTNAIQTLVAGDLIDTDGEPLPAEHLADKDLIALYFSAQWCPPCRKFTPTLVDFYGKHGGGESVELIFVSSDKSPAKMQEYRDAYHMPWPAVRHGSAAHGALRAQYAGNGIPCLVLLRPDGTVVAHSYDGDEYLGPQNALRAWQQQVPTQ